MRPSHRTPGPACSLGFVTLGALAGCSTGGTAGPKATATFPPPPGPSPVIAFAETQPVTALASSGNRLYVGTNDGLVVWQVARGSFDRWGEGHGLPDPRVRALATDARLGLWVLTDRGLHLYNEDHFVGFEGAPADVARAKFLVAASDGRTAWVGGTGVWRVRDGEFAPFLAGAQVTTMLRDADGLGLWVGTAREGAYRFAVDRFLSFGKDWGLTLHDIDGIALTKKGDAVLSGKAPDGARLAYYDGSRFWTYGAGGAEVRVLGTVGKQVRIAVNRRIYALGVGDAKSGTALTPTEQGAPVLRLKEMPGEVPDTTTAILADAQGVYFGTPALGVVRDKGEALRTRDVRGDRDRLAVGCDAAACYFVGGGGRLYRLAAGAGAVEPVDLGDARVMWVGNDPGGDLVVLRGAAGQRGLQLCLFDGGKVVPRQVAEIQVPSGEPYVNFARFAPGGDLWIGLSQRGEDGELGHYGVAVLKASGGAIYHRASPEKKRGKIKDGGLPLPEEVRGAAFLADTVWLATLGGLVRIAAGEADWLSRDEAPVGEMCSDVAVGKDGTLWAASPDGLCHYEDGKWETMDRTGPLSRGASALQLDAGGELLVGTQAGVIRWDGSAGDRLDGTVGDGVLDMDTDRSGRLWVLTMDGYSIHPKQADPR